jgi:MFS family permease
MPKIVLEYNLSYLSIGILIACFSLPFALFQMLFGSLSARIGRKKLMCFGIALNSLAFLTIFFSSNFYSLALILLIGGVGGSSYHPLGIAFISELYYDRRGQALGFHQTGGALGAFLAPLAIGFITELYGWRSAFLTFSSLGFILLPLLWLILRETRKSHVLSKVSNVFLNKKVFTPILLVILASAFSLLGLRGLNPFATNFFQTEKRVTYVEAAMLFSLLQIAGIFSGPICGRVSDVLGRKRVISILILIQALSLLTITFTVDAPLISACIVFGFTTFGLMATTDALFIDVIPRDFLGILLGLHMTVNYAVSVITPLIIGGMIDQYGFAFSYSLLSVLTPVSIIFLIKIKSR